MLPKLRTPASSFLKTNFVEDFISLPKMTGSADLEKATKEIQDANNAKQTILTTLSKFQQISGFIDQAHALIHKPEEKPQDVVPKGLVWKELSAIDKRQYPILYPQGKDFDAMYCKFKEAARQVTQQNGLWPSVKTITSFNSMHFSGCLSLETMFDLLWLIAAALNQNFSNETWSTSNMEQFIQALNMLSALKFHKK